MCFFLVEWINKVAKLRSCKNVLQGHKKAFMETNYVVWPFFAKCCWWCGSRPVRLCWQVEESDRSNEKEKLGFINVKKLPSPFIWIIVRTFLKLKNITTMAMMSIRHKIYISMVRNFNNIIKYNVLSSNFSGYLKLLIVI